MHAGPAQQPGPLRSKKGLFVAFLRGQLDADGYPMVGITVIPSPSAKARVGQTPAAGVEVTALIDTGANKSLISPAVAASLGICPIAAAQANLSGTPIDVYPVRFAIPATQGLFQPLNVNAGAITPNTPGADAVIGDDILKKFTFIYRGSARDFIFSTEDVTVKPGSNPGQPPDFLLHIDE